MSRIIVGECRLLLISRADSFLDIRVVTPKLNSEHVSDSGRCENIKFLEGHVLSGSSHKTIWKGYMDG